MSRRSLGLALCVLGFIAVCVMALISAGPRPFGGLPGIEEQLEERVADVLLENGIAADQAVIDATGRQVTVQLPATVPAPFDREKLEDKLNAVEDLRGDVTLTGLPTIQADDFADTADQTPVSEPEPTEVPATAVPQVEPTEVPEPEPTEVPEPEPTAEPAPEPTVAPSLEEIVAAFARGPIDFEDGTAVLTDEDTAVLDVIADELRGQTSGSIEVQAHTDNVGDPDANLLLSQDRAEAVENYLIEQGVDSALLTSRGYGASQPVANNSTEQGRIDNRRVVFVVEGN